MERNINYEILIIFFIRNNPSNIYIESVLKLTKERYFVEDKQIIILPAIYIGRHREDFVCCMNIHNNKFNNYINSERNRCTHFLRKSEPFMHSNVC